MWWRTSRPASPNKASFENLRSLRADAPRRQRHHDDRRHDKPNIIRKIAELWIRVRERPRIPGLIPERQRGGQSDNPSVEAVTHARPVLELFRGDPLPAALQPI